MKIAICDDDEIFLNDLKKRIENSLIRLNSFDNSTEIILFSNGVDVVEYNKSAHIDIIFLDVEMPEINGYDAAEKLRQETPEILIAFITNHDEKLFYTCDYQPIGLIRKSHINEIDTVIEKAIKKIAKRNISDMHMKVMIGKNVFETINKEVIYFTTYKHYIIVKTVDPKESGKFRGKMNEIEEQVEELNFVRMSTNIILNLCHIDHFAKGKVVLDNGEVIGISKPYREKAEKIFHRYNRGIR